MLKLGSSGEAKTFKVRNLINFVKLLSLTNT